MKSLFKNYPFLAIVFLIFAIPQQAFSQVFPEKPSSLKLVNDFAKIYSAQESNLLEEKLIAYNNKTSTQIAVVAIASLGGYPIDDYAIKLANKWQIGQKGKDNGLLILIAKEDRKVFVASGYGMEGVLNDGKIGTIIRTKMIPHFKNGNYYAATNDGVDAMIAAAGSEYANDKTNHNVKDRDRQFFAEVIIYLALFFILIFIAFNCNNTPVDFYHDRIFYGGRRSSGLRSGGFGGGSFGGGGAGGSW
jgi:uncharacterized protein